MHTFCRTRRGPPLEVFIRGTDSAFIIRVYGPPKGGLFMCVCVCLYERRRVPPVFIGVCTYLCVVSIVVVKNRRRDT